MRNRSANINSFVASNAKLTDGISIMLKRTGQRRNLFGRVGDRYLVDGSKLGEICSVSIVALSSARMNRADKVKRAHGAPATFLFYIRPLIKESGWKRRAINAFALPLKSLPRTFDDDTPWNRTCTILNSSSQSCHQLRIRSEKGENSNSSCFVEVAEAGKARTKQARRELHRSRFVFRGRRGRRELECKILTVADDRRAFDLRSSAKTGRSLILL